MLFEFFLSYQIQILDCSSLCNVADYPMARPLHIYTDGIPDREGDSKEKAVNEYLRFILGEGQGLVPEIGYVKLALIDEGLAEEQLDKL